MASKQLLSYPRTKVILFSLAKSMQKPRPDSTHLGLGCAAQQPSQQSNPIKGDRSFGQCWLALREAVGCTNIAATFVPMGHKQPWQLARQSLASNQLIQGSALSVVVNRPCAEPRLAVVQTHKPTQPRTVQRRKDYAIRRIFSEAFHRRLCGFTTATEARAPGLDLLGTFASRQKYHLASRVQEGQPATAGGAL